MENQVDIEIFEKEPEMFSPQVQVAACYLELDNKLLLLQRALDNSEPGKWGVPAEKMEENETPENAAKRELFEETGISLDRLSQIQSLGSLYIRKPEIDYIFHLFEIQLYRIPDVHLSDEHQSYKWASLNDLEKMPLMAGARQALQYYRTSFLKNRSGASVNTCLT